MGAGGDGGSDKGSRLGICTKVLMIKTFQATVLTASNSSTVVTG